MLLTIIIPALNEEQNIETILNNLKNQIDNQGNDVKKEKYNILVVDNRSADNTAGLVRRYCQQNKLRVGITYEAVQNIIAARKAGIRKVQEDPLYNNTRFLAFCDADVVVPNRWINSILEELKDKNIDILSYNGCFPHSFWKKVPRLAERYISEVGTLFFPLDTIRHYKAYQREIKLSRKIYSDFIRPPSGGFFAIRMETYNSVFGYEREFTDQGKEVDGPTWRLYIKLIGIGANLKFVPNIDIINSERRLLGDPKNFFRIQKYDQLSSLRQDLREIDEDQYDYVDNLANSIDFEPIKRYAVEYYLLFPCVNKPELVLQNEEYFGSLIRKVDRDIHEWREKHLHPKGQDVFKFCDELTDNYFKQLWNEMPKRRENI